MNDFKGLVSITDRCKIDCSAVSSLDSFDDSVIEMTQCGSRLTVEGEGLSITELDLERGMVSAVGEINGIFYSDGNSSSSNGIMSRLFGKKA